jgi:4-hydroxy-tetrahydrodipicolinate synthase
MDGIWTVIPTIFNSNNDIDIDTMKVLINHQIKSGVNGIVLNGTTSEVSTLSHEERTNIYYNIAKKYKNTVPIMIGVGGNNTKEVEEVALQAKLFRTSLKFSIKPGYFIYLIERGYLTIWQEKILGKKISK